MSGPTFTVMTLGELFALKVPNVEYLVDDILPRGFFGMISAR